MVLKNVIRYVALTIALCAMGYIFYNSSQTATSSSKTSMGVSETIAEIVVPDFNQKTEEEKTDIVHKINVPLRAFAHGAEFCFLSFFVTVFLRTFESEKFRRFIIPISTAFCFLYALSDEWHQTFVAGRGAEWLDVGVDTLGAFLGSLIAVFVSYISIKIYLKRKNKISA